jgi:hypothetical protein
MMERFFEILERPAAVEPSDKPMLEEIVGRYPWFERPKGLLLRLAHRMGDEETAQRMHRALSLRLSAGPVPTWMLEYPDPSLFQKDGSRAMIDRFLSLDEKRIVPENPVNPVSPADPINPAGPANETPAEPQADLSLAAEFSAEGPVSEMLARIYRDQGHYDRAIDIYRQLSLKFPEKSVYFADAIEKISKDRNANKNAKQ